METLPDELLEKILFPKYYKCKKKTTLNEKIIKSFNLQNNINVGKQINSLVKEFHYQRNRSDFNMWRKSSHPNYIYILYKSLEKKNKEGTLNLTKNRNISNGNYNTFMNDNILNILNNFYNNYNNNLYNFSNNIDINLGFEIETMSYQ